MGDYHNSSELGFDPRYGGAAPSSPAISNSESYRDKPPGTTKI